VTGYASSPPPGGKPREAERTVAGWPLPNGRTVGIDGPGEVFVREVDGPPGAPVVVLLHGLGATSGLQFFATMNQLSETFRVIAPDMRTPVDGSGKRRAFSLEHAADDVAAVLDASGVQRALVVGYSIGGFVAQVLVQQRPDLVAGIVYVATVGQTPAWLWPKPLDAISAVVRGIPRPPARTAGPQQVPDNTTPGFVRWLMDEIGKLDVPMMLDALDAMLHFRPLDPNPADDLPVAFIVTTRDRLVPPSWQRAFATRSPIAPVYEVSAGHAASGLAPDRFGPIALQACCEIARRARLN